MRPIAFALCAALAVFGARADSPPMPSGGEAAWKADLVETNEAYAKTPTAILKIDDAIYLKPGQTAWLVHGPKHPIWTLTAPAEPSPSVAFAADSKSAVYSDPEGSADLLADGASPRTMSATTRVSAVMAQISPDEMGLRIAAYDDNNPIAASFTGVEYFPYDPSFVVEAQFQPAPEWQKKIFQTSRGWYKAFYYAGDAVFTLKGKPVRLPMYAGTDKLAELDSLAAFIMDDTTGAQTYGVGRYIDVEVAKGVIPSKITLDFNYLYNPNCARSPHYNCPVAVDRIAAAITAGEKKPSETHAAN